MDLNDKQVSRRIIEEAWVNDSFKKALLADPIAALEKFTGSKIELPEGTKLEVRDQTDESAVFINIPAQEQNDDIELDEEQLEAVAGGLNFDFRRSMLSNIRIGSVGDSPPPPPKDWFFAQ